MRYIRIGLIFFLLLFMCSHSVTAQSEIYFEANDPPGDDNGYGVYEYPTNPAFRPYEGIFDILEFKVSVNSTEEVFFDTRFSKMTNPWLAPEGFIHQNLHIYIDALPGQGLTISPNSGINVAFPLEYAWDFCVKAVGWNNSELLTVRDGKVEKRKIQAQLLNDGLTIRATVPAELLPTLKKDWHYTVLVGSYDGFGEDFFRKASSKPSEWLLGGGKGSAVEPLVFDMLASDKGARTQKKQLGSFDVTKGLLAEVYPMNISAKNLFQKSLLTVGLLIMLVFVWFKRRKLFDRYFK